MSDDRTTGTNHAAKQKMSRAWRGARIMVGSGGLGSLARSGPRGVGRGLAFGGRRRVAVEPGVGPDHAVAGVLVLAEVDDELQLLRPRHRQREPHRRAVGAE